MIHNDPFRRLLMRLYVLVFFALLFGITRYSYRAKELLVCWLFFCSLFAALALTLFAAVLATFTGRYFLKWLSAAKLSVSELAVRFAAVSQEAILVLGILIAGTWKTQPRTAPALDAEEVHSGLLIDVVTLSKDGVRK